MKQLNVRVEDELYAAITKAAHEAQVPTAVFVREALQQATKMATVTPMASLGMQRSNPAPVRRLNPVAQEKVAKGCAHPRESLQKLGYLTKCGLCGTRVR